MVAHVLDIVNSKLLIDVCPGEVHLTYTREKSGLCSCATSDYQGRRINKSFIFMYCSLWTSDGRPWFNQLQSGFARLNMTNELISQRHWDGISLCVTVPIFWTNRHLSDNTTSRFDIQVVRLAYLLIFVKDRIKLSNLIIQWCDARDCLCILRIFHTTS